MPDLWGQTVNFGGILLGDRLLISLKTYKAGDPPQEETISFGGIVISLQVPYVRPIQRLYSIVGPDLWYLTLPAILVNENRMELNVLVADAEQHKAAIDKFINVCDQNAITALKLEFTPSSCANSSSPKKMIFTINKPIASAYVVAVNSREGAPLLQVSMSLMYSSIELDVQPAS